VVISLQRRPALIQNIVQSTTKIKIGSQFVSAV